MARLDPTGVSRILSYIKTWVTTALGGKANSSHTHTKANITDFPAYGNTAGTICQGNDSRLSDARTPTSHTHTKSQITDFPTIPTNTNQLTNGAGFITSSGSCNYANSAGYVQGNNNSANAANALLRSGSGRTDSSPEGDTWIFLDEVGGTSTPWGFKHNQGANTIGFYGRGTETSSINLSNGYFSGSCNYANSAGGVAWSNVSGKPSSYTPSSHNHDSVYLKLSGGTITGNISKNNTSTSWVQGRNTAPFRTIAASSPGDSQYVPCWSAKSYQGSWDCGPYTSNVLHLSYITDANYNSGSNTQTADFTFATDGTFNAKVLKQNGTAVSLSGHTHTKSQITDFPTIPTVNNATLTIQKNGSNVATFTANASSNVTANITVPTKTSQLTNDSEFWSPGGGKWNPNANISLPASGNGQEWSFDMHRNGKTGCYWHVWEDSLGTLLKVNADDGAVSVPRNIFYLGSYKVYVG